MNKICSGCNVEKPTELFYTHPHCSMGVGNKCKECVSREASEKRQNPDTRDAILEKDKEKRVKCRDKRIESARRYRCLETSKIAARKRSKKYRKKYPQQRKANQCLNKAVVRGEVSRPESCSKCGVKCKPDGHHWSYIEEHWLDVIWLCGDCHRGIHNNKEALLRMAGKWLEEEGE